MLVGRELFRLEAVAKTCSSLKRCVLDAWERFGLRVRSLRSDDDAREGCLVRSVGARVDRTRSGSDDALDPMSERKTCVRSLSVADQ